MNPWEAYQSDHLFLLVGTNPLPNYVAALLLAKDKGTIHFLHSTGTRGTGPVAERLQAIVARQRPQVSVYLHEINEADGLRIVQKSSGFLDDIEEQATVGLHYTGGTKSMAVHTYRAIEARFPYATFSYLDARTLSLIIDGREGRPTKPIPVGRVCEVTLNELLALHGYPSPDDLRREPFQPNLCRVLAQIHSAPMAFQQWRDWMTQDKFQALPDPARYPALQDAVHAFDALCGGQATSELVAQRLGWTNLVSCSKWLLGDWLEEYSLWAIQQAAQAGQCGDYGINLEMKNPQGRQFQFDAAAMRGYRLFAFSCLASKEREKCEEHLLEAYIRARQIGGDEACVALVCCYHDPNGLRHEIEETWFTEGRVEVFGMTDLPDPPTRVQEWFETPIKPR